MQKSFQHHMLREIYEQPDALTRTLKEEWAKANRIAETLNAKDLKLIYLTGSGTSYHACLAVNYAISTITSILSSTIPASEFASWTTRAHTDTVLIAISQSGESTDVINAANSAIQSGMRTIAVTNTPESSLARICDFKLFSRAGPEKALTATKSFTCTILAAQLLILELAKLIEPLPKYDALTSMMNQIPQLVERSIQLSEEDTRIIAERYKDKEFFFLLGSGPNYATALEGALKLKESCNVYAEGFATREFLHGPMQLVDRRTPILILENPGRSDEVMKLAESFERFEAPVVIISSKHNSNERQHIKTVGGVDEIFLPLVDVISLQLYSYYSSVARGLNPDNPPKLKKVVR
ncbi:MAG TPA: SIS domain-containing protein [Candidatus Acidoferrum sp.]|nr:SIS domain-containing protein [Candidatus Acidoferrum sp.]